MSESFSDDELAALVLPWAKEHKLDAYEKTLAVANRPAAFRNYLVRLLEVRWLEDEAWRTDVPLRALEATSLSLKFKARLLGEGVEIHVAGERYQGERQWSFGELQMLLTQGADLNVLHSVKQNMDLVIDDPRTRPKAPPMQKPQRLKSEPLPQQQQPKKEPTSTAAQQQTTVFGIVTSPDP